MLIMEATPSTVPRPPTACSYLHRGGEFEAGTGKQGFRTQLQAGAVIRDPAET